MKAAFPSVFVRLVFVVVALVLAYLAGNQHRPDELKTSAPSKIHAQNGTILANSVTGLQTGGKLTREQALARWKAILASPNSVVGSWIGLMPELNADDIPYLIDQLSDLPRSDDRDFAIAHLLLGANDPDAALGLAGKITNVTNQSNLLNDIYVFMARQDPGLVMSELANLPAGQSAQDAYLRVFQLMAGSNSFSGPDIAALIMTLPPEAIQAQALSGLATGWAYHDPAAALAWASNLPPEDSAALKAALIATNNRNPDLAAQYVDNLTDASARGQMIQSISQSMAKNDPAAALDWLDEKATGDNYDRSVINIFSALAKNNPAAATSYLDKVMNSTVRQTVITNLAASWAKYNSQATLTWLQSLPDSDAAIRDPLIQKLGPSKFESADTSVNF